MSARPDFPILIADDDHVLRLAQDLMRWDDPAARPRARAFFHPEIAEDSLLDSVFRPLRERVRPVLLPPGAAPGTARALLGRRGGLPPGMPGESPALRLVQRLGERRKGLDIEACLARGIAVSLLPRHSLAQVADHTLMLMLALVRRLETLRRPIPGILPGAPGSVRYNWPGITGLRALSGLTLGIVGMGEIGRLVARRAEAFDLRILWTAREAGPEREAQRDLPASWQRETLPGLLARADIVSLHVPPAGLSGPILDAAALAQMKRGALVINTARGALIDEAALARALACGHLGGAGLDVHDREPFDAADALHARPEVLSTPHIAGGSRLGVLTELQAICDNLVDTLDGLPPRHGRVTA